MVSSVQVAQPASTHETKWYKTAGIITDISDLCESKSVFDATLNTVSLGADVVGFVMNPVKTVVSHVVSWIMDHIAPLPDMLQKFTGDPEQVEAAAITWQWIGAQWKQAGDELDADFHSQLSPQVCRTLSAYKVEVTGLVLLFRKMAEVCDLVATGLCILSAVVKIVYELTRDAIADLIGTFAEAVAEALLSVGTLLPKIAYNISTTVASWVTKIKKKGSQVLEGFRSANGIFSRLESILKSLGTTLNNLFASVSNLAGKTMDKVGDALHHVAGKHADTLGKIDDMVDAGRAGIKKVTDKAKPIVKGAYEYVIKGPVDVLNKPSDIGKAGGFGLARALFKDPDKLKRINQLADRKDLWQAGFKRSRELLGNAKDYKDYWDKLKDLHEAIGGPKSN